MISTKLPTPTNSVVVVAQHLEFLPGDILCDTVQPFFVISLAMNFTLIS